MLIKGTGKYPPYKKIIHYISNNYTQKHPCSKKLYCTIKKKIVSLFDFYRKKINSEWQVSLLATRY